MRSRYDHELDYMRNISQRPAPSRSLDRSIPNPSSISSSRNRTRSQSTTTHNHGHKYSSSKVKTTYFDRNDGGWLESSPIQLSASTSHSSFAQNSQHSVHASIEECNKDMLCTISNDDILKLTQLTNKLPSVSTKYNHIHKGHSHSKQRQPLVGDESMQSDGGTGSNDSRYADTDLVNLLNQDYMMSSPISDTDYSAILTIPTYNPSSISTDTDDSHFSWHKAPINHINKFSEQPPSLRKTLSEQTTATAAAEEMRSDYPLNISTAAPFADSDLVQISSGTSRHHKHRPWYKPSMKRDKKGKAKYSGSPVANNDEPTLDVGYDSDYHPSYSYHTHQHEPFSIGFNTDYRNLRNGTHPMTTTTPNKVMSFRSSGTSTKKQHASIHRFRLPTRRKKGTSFGIRDEPSIATGDKRLQRQSLLGRRHSFDSMHDYDSPFHGTGVQRPITTTAAATGKPSKQLGKSPLSDTLTGSTSQMSSTSSIATSTSSFLATSPPSPYLSSTNIPSSANGNDSSRKSSSTLSSGTPKTGLDDREIDNNEIDSSAVYSNQHQPTIEVTPALSRQQSKENHQINHQNLSFQKTLYFDYDSLPWDSLSGEPQSVKAFVKRMVDNKYGRMIEMRIKFANNNDEDDEHDDGYDHVEPKMDDSRGNDEEDGDNGVGDNVNKDRHCDIYPSIEPSKIIGGDAYYTWLNKRHLSIVETGTRRIAEIHVAGENDTGFFKLTQLAEESMLIKGRLLNLHISFLVPGKSDDAMSLNYQEASFLDQSINDRLLSLNFFIDDAKVFLSERNQKSRIFTPMESTTDNTQQHPSTQYDGSRKTSDSSNEAGIRHTNYSSSSSSSSSSLSSTASIVPISTSKSQQQSVTSPSPPLCPTYSHGSPTCLSTLCNYVPCHHLSTYDCRQKQLRDAISEIRRGMEDFKRSLIDTENMVHGVQIDMNDTKAKMDTYLKDVPETHYSELKRLEDSIESILANRAKSRGMELLYWILTALLTGCAFLLWALICALKLGQAAIAFPRKMIKAFNDHIEERNKEVKRAGLRIVAKGVEQPRSFDQLRSFRHAQPDEIASSSTDVLADSFLQRSSSSRQTPYSPTS